MELGFTLKCKDGGLHAQIRDSVLIYLECFKMTKIKAVKIMQWQTQEDVLAGEAAIKQNPFVILN